MADNYEPLGPVDAPPPPPPPDDHVSMAPAQTKFENAAAGKSSKTDLRTIPVPAPKSKKLAAKSGSNDNDKKSGRTIDDNQNDDEEGGGIAIAVGGDDDDEEGSKKAKKMNFGKRANVSILIVSTVMALSCIGMLIGIFGVSLGWTLPESSEK